MRHSRDLVEVMKLSGQSTSSSYVGPSRTNVDQLFPQLLDIMKKLHRALVALFVGPIFLMWAGAHAGQESANTPPSDSRIIVRSKTENLRQSNPGPFREPLIKFVEGLAEEVTIKINGRGVYATKSTE